LRIITAPENLSEFSRPALFLAGSIEMGTAHNWQEEISQRLTYQPGTILNPRRRNWDASWIQSIENPQFVAQVEWELQALTLADVIIMHFEPDAKAPVSLLELGLFHEKMIVHCPEGFWRKGNVDIVCRWFEVPTVRTMEELTNMTIENLRGFRDP
jgi:nucleoside 2-deoxyribosyltransferase-like protein